MKVKKLAINGGAPISSTPFPIRRTMGPKEIDAAVRVMKTGDLSLFFGSPGEFFLGGPEVRRFEDAWAKKYSYNHCVSVNSWTTGLVTAVGAVGIEPGDEVICTPSSMSATATSILFYGGIPVFADIDPITFNLSPDSIREKITPRTRAIMVVHLFGHPAPMNEILDIAKEYNLRVIEDAAHAPSVKYHGRYVGAIGDIGGFSFNYHKHIHTGEGGLIVTQDAVLAERCQLIRNHGENVYEDLKIQDISNCIGSNYRLTEIQAAIGSIQMDLIENFVAHRNELAHHMSQRLSQMPGLTPATILPHCEHAFYCYPIKLDEIEMGISRDTFVKAVNKELPDPEIWEQTPLTAGYVEPLYMNPIYQTQTAIGKSGFPFSMNPGVNYDYSWGICPTTERMWEKELILCPILREPVTTGELDNLLNAFEKVIENVDELRR